MKKTHFALYAALLFMCVGGGNLLHAQESVLPSTNSFSVGGGIEANGNARDTVSLGVAVHAEYRFWTYFSIGLKGTYSFTIAQLPKALHFVEATAFIRWSIRSSDKIIVPFLQPEAGTVVVVDNSGKNTEEQDSDTTAITMSTGLTGGVRFNVTEHFYIEPYGRFGYIHFWAGGIMFGSTFSRKPAGYNVHAQFFHETGDDGGTDEYNGYEVNSSGGEYIPDYEENYYDDYEDIYGLSAYSADEDSINSLIERILYLEAYPESNQDELYALNDLLNELLLQMDSATDYDEYY